MNAIYTQTTLLQRTRRGIVLLHCSGGRPCRRDAHPHARKTAASHPRPLLAAAKSHPAQTHRGCSASQSRTQRAIGRQHCTAWRTSALALAPDLAVDSSQEAGRQTSKHKQASCVESPASLSLALPRPRRSEARRGEACVALSGRAANWVLWHAGMGQWVHGRQWTLV